MEIHLQNALTVTAMVQLVQSVQHMVAMTVRHAPMTVVVDLLTETAMTVRHALVTAIHVLHTATAMVRLVEIVHRMVTAIRVQLMVAQVQQRVAATVAK
jgi:hypothetical protein